MLIVVQDLFKSQITDGHLEGCSVQLQDKDSNLVARETQVRVTN